MSTGGQGYPDKLVNAVSVETPVLNASEDQQENTPDIHFKTILNPSWVYAISILPDHER